MRESSCAMSPRANFDESLQLPDPAKGPGHGPLAGGPVPDGEELAWVYVWILQNGPAGRAAAAYGESEHDQDSRGTTFRRRWDLPTEMAHDSDDFTPGRPAQATAMALVNSEGGARDVYWWSEAVMIAPPQPSTT